MNIKTIDAFWDRNNLYNINFNFRNLSDFIESFKEISLDGLNEGKLTQEQFEHLQITLNGLVKKGNIGVNDIDLNKGKIDQTMVSDELLQQIAGNASVNATPADNSITTNKLVRGAITPEKTSFIVTGKNIFDKSKALIGKLLNNNNTMIDSPTYDVSQEFVLAKGEQITVSKLRNYNFINSATNEVTADTTTRTNFTFTAPANGIFKFTLFHADLDITQVEYGTVATEYESYYKKLADDISTSTLSVDNSVNYNVIKTGDSYNLKTVLNGKELEIRMYKKGSKNDSFNFDRTLYDGNIVHGTSDDITPVRTFTTVGANHGYTCIIEIPITDKVKADLGSVWTDGTTQYVLLRIVSGMLVFGCPYSDTNGYVTSSTVSPVATLTHVSGATNKTNIPITGVKTNTQLYPSTGKINVSILTDGNPVEQDGNYKSNKVDVIENYEILDYKSIVEFAKSNIGKDYADYRNSIQGVLSMSNTFHFYDKGKCTTSHSIRPLQKVLMGRTGVLQSVSLEHPSLPSYRFVPNVSTVGSVDFTQPIDLSKYNTSNLIYKSNLIDETKPTDRYIDYIKNGETPVLAFTMGHIVDKTNSSYNDRLANIPNILWDFRSTKKSYPTVLENKIIDVGEYFNFQGYRNYYVPKNGVINSNTVIDSQSTYIYIDAMNEVSFKATNFSELIGSQVEVVASSGFDLKTNIIDSNGLNYSITEPNGYAILKTI
ncbi:hypothetical protein [Staphylococcus saprophyticus]|uniref:hypothetical protein n=1 Tax=Staphylococcus saprophyticus TaxID=29385 RepID=UPI002DBB5094|nr:hypothetical protein [Staphylococcus saprophyticus]MEB8335808.1 hypothetical protein [Staphylococcus saprophyticus]